METGSGDGDTVQGDTAGVHGRGETGKDCGVRTAGTLREPVPHKRLREGARFVPRQLHNESR